MEILAGQGGFVRATPLTWQQQVSQAVRSPLELRRRLGLAEDPPSAGESAASRDFPVFVPLPWLNRIRPGDPLDPLLLQVLAVAAETEAAPGFVPDPLAESGLQPLPGLLHKYAGRVLLIAAGACAINCRYCFRRHFPYESALTGKPQLQAALDHIAADPGISEVLLSGGDPLMLPDGRLNWLIEQLQEIPHLQRFRIHTRLPVAIPARITDGLVGIFQSSRLQSVMVLHSNHPRELDGEVQRAMLRLRKESPVVLLNQSVLLRGVNDCAETLTGLSLRLLDCGVLPYYLHQLDPVAGASHFFVPPEVGLRLVEAMREALPGYLVPRYVQEVPGEASKTPLA